MKQTIAATAIALALCAVAPTAAAGRSARRLKQLPPGCVAPEGEVFPFITAVTCDFGLDFDQDGLQDYVFDWTSAGATVPDGLGVSWFVNDWSVSDQLGAENFDEDGNFLGLINSPFIPGASYFEVNGDTLSGSVKQEYFPDQDLIFEWVEGDLSSVETKIGPLLIEAEALPYSLNSEGFDALIGGFDVSLDFEELFNPLGNFFPFSEDIFGTDILGINLLPEISLFSYGIEFPDNIAGRFASNVAADVVQAIYSGILG